jgi:hypothetical protein
MTICLGNKFLWNVNGIFETKYLQNESKQLTICLFSLAKVFTYSANPKQGKN